MKAKLIKHEVDYYCLLNNKGEVIADVNGGNIQKLSKQNCDEIFGVVDVEKLASDYANEKLNEEYSSSAGNFQAFCSSFRQGFNKAMELNKDKVFTLEQMSVAYNTNRSGTLFEQLINSFGGQPTEIEVEIVMFDNGYEEWYGDNYNGEPIWIEKLEPKLDSDGCLILKRVV